MFLLLLTFREYEPQPAAAASDSEDEGSGEDEVVSFTDVKEVLSTEQENPGHFTLPPHLRCASHILNFFSTVDIEKWLIGLLVCVGCHCQTTNIIYRSATAKCSALWTKASRSTVAAELDESVCGKKLIDKSQQ